MNSLALENYNWRPPQEADLPALAVLDVACLQADGPASVGGPAYADLLAAATDTSTPMLCATPEGDATQVVAVGWVQAGSPRSWLWGKVHPELRRRGLGTHLLRWSEEQAATSQPETFNIRNEALTESSEALYTGAGYACDFVELWMERDLHEPLPAPAQSFPHETWTDDNASDFYKAYLEAFSTRRAPGSPVDSAEEWIAEYADDSDFRPDLSLLVRAEGKPVGFLAAGVFYIADIDKTVGWVSQVGSDPAWRGRGVGAWLMIAALESFAREGFDTAGLHVNVNNPGAIRLYERLGFRVAGRRGKFSKPASARA